MSEYRVTGCPLEAAHDIQRTRKQLLVCLLTYCLCLIGHLTSRGN